MAKLGEVCKVSPSTKNIERQGAWLLNLDMVEQQTGRVIEYKYVGEDDLNGSIIQFDTENVLYSKLRPNLNKVVLPQKDGFSTSELLPLRPDAGVLNRDYLAAFLRSDSFVTWAVSKTAGAKMPRLGTKDLMNAEIPMPEIEQQKTIAEKFKKLEQLISLRKQQLEKLDELVKARFVEMFGSYPENEKAYPVVNVSDVADAGVGVVIKPAQYYVTEECGIKAFRSLNIGEMYIKDSDWVYFSTKGNESNKKSQLHENDLLIVRSGAPGTSCVVTKEFEGCNAVDVIIAHPDLSKVNPWYLCAYINYPHGKKQIEEGTGGAAQQHFNVGKCNNLKVLLPPLELQNQFAAFVERVNQQKQTVQQSLEKLELMKKALMQEYFG